MTGVLIYLFGLLCFFPDVITLNDEQRYLEAAYAFSKASLCLDEIDPLSGAMACRQSSSYLPGTSALLAARCTSCSATSAGRAGHAISRL
jgi:hypothetical protein